MGGNGSFAIGDANTEEGRQYKCIAVLDDNVKVLVPKDPKKGIKLPEESHTPNRIYVSLHGKGNKEGQLKSIGVYGEDGLKKFEIHTTDHRGLGLHCHYWHNGHPSDAQSLTIDIDMLEIYNKILNYCSMGEDKYWKDFFDKINKESSDDKVEKPEETEVIGYDLLGYPYNKKYPANVELYGPNNDGYSSPYRATLFYAFAVQHYDLEFSYRGKHYYCLSERDYVALCDSSYSKEYQRFDNANVFIETFEVEGKKLIDIIDDLDYVEPI